MSFLDDIGSAITSGASDVLGVLSGSNSAGAQAQQVQNALNYQYGATNTFGSQLNPYSFQGQNALNQLMAGLQNGQFSQTVTPQTLQNDPGYQFRMQQAQQALQRAASAKGMLGSTAYGQTLDQYTQGLAAQQYQQAFENQQQLNNTNFSRLAGLAGMGLQAGSDISNLTQQNANSVAGLFGAMGNAQAAATQSQDNFWNGLISGGANQLGSMFGGGGGGMGGLSSMFGGMGGAGGAGGAGISLGGMADGGASLGSLGGGGLSLAGLAAL